MLKNDEKVLVSKELVQQFEEINRALDKCCDLALQQPIPNKQIAMMTDASFGAAGYAVLIEDDPSQNFTSIRKSYAPVVYGSTFSATQIKMSIYANDFTCNLFRIQGIWACFLGRAETGHYTHRQQSGDQIFPDKNCTPSPVECM